MRRLVVVLSLALMGFGLATSPGCGEDGHTPVARTILLITADTLRRDHVGCYAPAGGRSLTPRLDALAAEGLRFDDARTPVPLTLPAHTTMLAGLPPAATGVRTNSHGRIPDRSTRGFSLLPERLRDAGWRTGAFVSAAPLVRWYGLDAGFEAYDDLGLDESVSDLAYVERAGEETVERALAWLRGLPRGDRAFLWVHLFEPHAPYAPELPPQLPPSQRYAADVAHLDRIVGTLLDGLPGAGRTEAVVLVAADHGEALDELGERTHGLLLGDAVLRVPFLLRVPGGPSGVVRTDPVDLADVAPTLAAIAGLPTTTGDAGGPGTGRDLLAGPVPAGRIRVAESLYGRQRYGWAQLVGAVASGGMLVDAGGDRVLWLEPAPFLEPQASPGAARGQEGLPALAEALRAYRAGERKDLIRNGGVAGGYGHAGRTEPFLAPEENGRLPNPYDAVPRAHALDQHAAGIMAAGATPERILRLERMRDEDPGNPEIHFWLGQAHKQRALRVSAPEAVRAELEAARDAYLEAFLQGRKDATTLLLAVGVAAVGREGEALDLLRRLRPEVGKDCRLSILEARLLRALDRDGEADEVCASLDGLCRRPWEQADATRAGEDGTCR